MAYTITVTPAANASMTIWFFEINSSGTLIQAKNAVSAGLVSSLQILPTQPGAGNEMILSIGMDNGTTPGTTVSTISESGNTNGNATYSQSPNPSGTTRKTTNEQWYTLQGGSVGGPDVNSGGNGSSAAPSSGTSGLSTNTSEFVVGAHVYGGANTVTDTISSVGFTNEAQISSTAGTPHNQQAGYKLTTVTATQSYVGVLSSTESWGATVCAYKLPSGAAVVNGNFLAFMPS